MRNIYIGDRGVIVQYLQLALNRAGFPIAITGHFERETCTALREFLRDSVGCYVDRAAWTKLLPYLKGYTTHVIISGDTLYSIADMYNSSISAITTANPALDATNLQIGTRIYVPFLFPLVSEAVSYTSILNELVVEGLSIRYPFIMTNSIGESVMGKPVKYMQLGNGEKQIFYNASFHANEWITTPVLLKFAEEYAKAYAEKTDIFGEDAQRLFGEYSLFVVPMVNPDGVDLVNGVLKDEAYKRSTADIAANYPDIPYPDGWKANIDGIDLNLQFPAGWEKAREIKFSQGFVSPAPRDYVGESWLVAPESMNIYNFTISHNFRLILAYHTQGEVIYWKYLDYEPENSRKIAEYFGEVSGYTVEDTPYASGFAGYKDWFIQNYNLPGYTIEVGLGENPLDMSQFANIYEANKYILLGGMTQV